MTEMKFPLEHINILFSDGGCGDNVARMSVIKYIQAKFPHVVQHVWVPDYFVDFAQHLLPDTNKLLIKSFTEATKKYNNHMTGVDAGSKRHTSLRTHLSDHAFHMIVDRMVEVKDKNYCQLRPEEIDISKFNLPEKYVVVTTGFTAEVRELIPETTNKIADYINSKGYTTVWLGQKHTYTGAKFDNIKGNFKAEIDYSKGLDLIDKTSLLQAGAIIAKSKCIVGLDNGLLHVAGCTEVPIIAGFTTVDPYVRLPYRHDMLGWNCFPVVPEEDLACRFCQSSFNFVYDFDFRKCYMKEKGNFKSIECLKRMSPEKFIAHLEMVLS